MTRNGEATASSCLNVATGLKVCWLRRRYCNPCSLRVRAWHDSWCIYIYIYMVIVRQMYMSFWASNLTCRCVAAGVQISVWFHVAACLLRVAWRGSCWPWNVLDGPRSRGKCSRIFLIIEEQRCVIRVARSGAYILWVGVLTPENT